MGVNYLWKCGVFHYTSVPAAFMSVGEYTFLSVCRKSNNITWRVPSYPFVSVACTTGERVYIRLRSEEYFAQQVCGLNWLVDAKKSS